MSTFVNTVDSIGDEALAGSIIDRSITEILDNCVTHIGISAFNSCSALTTVDFPAVTRIGNFAFQYCSALTTVNFPVVTRIDMDVFYHCSALTAVNFPAVTSIDTSAFHSCSKLTTVDFSAAVRIGGGAFFGCSVLGALILRSATRATLGGTDALGGTPIKSGTGYIYVPAALVDSYKAANNWSTYANQFRSLEAYTVDGTTTGALDASKI